MTVLSLIRGTDVAPANVLACQWRSNGLRPVSDPMGDGAMGAGGDLSFVVTQEAVPSALCSAPITLPDGPAVLRMDEVAFPEGAIAYRHIHPGPGIRTLVDGHLRLISDHETFEVRAGDSWFEDANSPVRAENLCLGISRFVRMMILPMALHGKPSIQILDAGDQRQPRLQVTHRHIDHIVTF